MQLRILNSLSGLLILFSGLAFAQKTKRPKLVVGIVVDQMRWDYLYRYNDRFSKGGFKRLLQQGFSCEQTYINYLPSFTACGHASIFTGSVPAIHGITGNEWLENGLKRYCTSDTTVISIGSISKAGQMSPRALLTTTIGDELKLATNFRSKVIGIALKDRGAILPAGHSADAAYWFDERTGNWISSSYYLKNLPKWLNDFNHLKLAEQYLIKGWNPLYTLASYRQSAADTSFHEGIFGVNETTFFPYGFVKEGVPVLSMLKTTPFANSLTLGLAKEAIVNEQLGIDETTDLLTISLSGTDYIGHHFGPNSVEIEDAYLRLDKDLETFLTFLDRKMGKDNYLFFLTADHSGAHNPDYLKENKIPAGYWDAKDLQRRLNNYLLAKYKLKELILPFLNYQLFFDENVLEDAGLDRNLLKKECIDFVKKEAGMAYVIDLERNPYGQIPNPIADRIVQGYHAGRSGVLQIVLKPAWFQLSHDRTGSIHGSWNAYDTHIPLILMGNQIKRGSTSRRINITDIAPTIAELLKIQPPNGNIGKVIGELSHGSNH